jgi:imidazolonepropionase-like amidohydrolase
MSKAFLSLILLIFYSAVFGQQQEVYIKAGLFYDSAKNELQKNKAICIKGNTIESIGAFSAIPNDKEVIDLSAYTVLPGLIDAHTHVMFSQEATEDFAEHSVHTLTMESDALRALRGAQRAKSYLDVGITSIKDLGNSGLYLDVALRDAINEKSALGPRIFASGPILAATGGQIYGVNHDHQDIINGEYRIIKSPEDAIQAVREHANQGVDLIKICADNIPNNTRLSIEEMTAIVKTAHGYGLTVTAHCVTDQSAYDAVMAGVDGVEHGFNISDSTLTLMAQKNVFLVPTENSSVYMETYARLAGYEKGEAEWIDSYLENMYNRLNKAIELQVPIVAGSDNYTDIGSTRGESSIDMLRAYFEAGMKPLDILQSATYNSAQYLKKEKQIGHLTPGAMADIIAVKGNIETDFLGTIERVEFVMKNGEVYLNKID